MTSPKTALRGWLPRVEQLPSVLFHNPKASAQPFFAIRKRLLVKDASDLLSGGLRSFGRTALFYVMLSGFVTNRRF